MVHGEKGKSVLNLVILLLLCVLLTVGVSTRLEEPVFTQVYYEQSNDRKGHTVYFYMIRNVEDNRGEPFRFCFPEDATIDCTLQPVRDYAAYSKLMMQDQNRWKQGSRMYGRYRVELLELRFFVPEEELRNGAVQLSEGKIYFREGYYQNIDFGTVIIYPDGEPMPSYTGQTVQPMTTISVGDFSERPYFATIEQVWRYLHNR